MTDQANASSITRAATLAAGFVVAQQVAGKACRDALFLSHHAVTALPKIWVVTAVLSIIVALLADRLLSRHAPNRVVPLAFVASSLLLLGCWAFYRRLPGMASVAVYLLVTVGGAVLVSGFWSLVSERFDPRTAKANFGRILAGGTLGGVVGGVLAERTGAWLSLGATLPLLSLLHMAAAWSLRQPALKAFTAPVDRQPRRESSARGERANPYLLRLGLLIALVTLSGTFLDYVFKSRAVMSLGSGAPLLGFFSAFHTGVSLFTFAVQAALSRPFLERWGLGRTASALPVAVIAGSAVVLLVPTLANVAALRGLEAVIRNSLFRSAYELFYTPVPAHEKRAIKTFLDVGVDRGVDAFGAALIQLAVVFLPALLERAMLATSITLSLSALLVAALMNRGYVRELQQSLITHAVELHGLTWLDKTTADTLLTLHGTELAHQPVARLSALRKDPHLAPALRARIVRALAAHESPDALEELVAALSDSHFDVRFEAGRALARLTRPAQGQKRFVSDPEHVLECVMREVGVSRSVWESRKITDSNPTASLFSRTLLERRKSLSLEHVFTLLSLISPQEPLIIVFHALHSGDEKLRGTALEYLDSTLPEAIRTRLWPFLEVPGDRASVVKRSRDAIMLDLERARETLKPD